MLIQSTLPVQGATSAVTSSSRGEVLARKPITDPVSVEDLYKEGSWKFDDGGETYQLSRDKAVGFMQRAGAAQATYTVWGAKGRFGSLSPADQRKRKTEAKINAIAKGLATSFFSGAVIAGGCSALGVLNSVGSLITRSGAGSGTGLGLGTLGAIAGVAGLLVGLSSYRSGLQTPVAELVQSGLAVKSDKGFSFEPNAKSPDSRNVIVTKESVTETQAGS